jgi:hypothetical protein
MKKKILLTSLFTAALLFNSCDENVSPKGKLPEDYVMNLIIRTDTTFQTATVTRVYDVDGFDPLELKTDPSVIGAKISLKYSDSNTEYYYRDTVDNNKFNSRFGVPSRYYYLKNMPILYGKEIEMKAVLPGGKVINAKTKIPEKFVFTSEGTTPFIPGPLVGRDTSNISVAWNNASTELVKMGNATLVYFYKEVDGTKTRYEKKVPMNIFINGNDTSTNYNVSSFRNDLKINRTILKNILSEISADNSAKGRYSIAPLEIEVFVMDENLTRYFSAGLLYDFGFTIRNLPTQISNMNGGLGFMGSYAHSKIAIRFEDQYLLNTFGYLRER